jgi:mannose-1-phosphate guanylyltransferase/phosphomannomutase
MKAVVMAGGQGARLRPLTSNQPKPMLPVLGEPMMEHILRLARRHGFTEVVATVHFLASIVRNYFGDGSDLDISLSYATEEEPLGTAGSVKNAEPLLGTDRFLVLSGDSVTDVDLTELVRFHEKKGAAVTVAVKRFENPLEFGIVITGEDGRVERFQEKPSWGDVFSDQVNTGVYVVEPEVLNFIPPDEEFDFSKDLFPLLLEKGLPIYGHVTDRYWTDVGNIDAYMEAHRAVLDRQVDIHIEGFDLGNGVWLGPGAELDPGAHVEGPVFIGENSRVEAGATLREHTVLGRGVVVRSGAFLHRAIIHDYVYIGPATNLRGCVIGKNSDVHFGARVEEGVVVAGEAHIGKGAVLNPHVKVYPFKSVEPGAIVSKSIVWQSGGARGLFGERGVDGLINVDVTPEMAVRLALAYGSILPKGASVVTCRDLTRSARIVKRAIVAGLNSGGVECHDLELVPTPAARFYARSTRAMGGLSVQTTAHDPASVEISFFDERGIDIGPEMQRRVERAYYRDDLRRAFHHDIGGLDFPARGREYYARGLLDSVDTGLIRRRQPKIVIDYAWGGTVLTGPAVLGRLGGDVLAVNGTLDEDRVVLSAEAETRHLESLSGLVRSSGAELGAMFDSPGERVRFVDGAGRVVDATTALLAFVSLVAETMDRPTVALPVATSRVAEELIRAGGGIVTWTRVAPSGLMEAAESSGVAFAGDEGGGYIFPPFLAAYDGVMALVKLLELLARAGTTLQEAVDGLPPAHVTRHEVAVPWESKGTVMRGLLERLGATPVVTIDGVKAYRGNDWALVAPHPQEPLVRVWAEAGSTGEAEALAREFTSMIEELRG